MQIKINGKETELSDNLTIQKLLWEKKINSKTIVIEFNGLILKPDLWPETVLNSNDKLEIIRIIGGG